MSQHISGDIGQSVSYEYGEFIRIGGARIRKALIKGYTPATTPKELLENKEMNFKPFGLNVFYDGPTISQTFDTEEERDKAMERLDWLFSGKVSPND